MADVIVVLDQHVLPALHRAGALNHLRRMAGLVIVPDAVLWPLLVEGCGDDVDIARRTAEIFAWVTASGAQVDDTRGLVTDPDGPAKGVAHWLSQRLPEHLAAGRSVIAAHAGGFDPVGAPIELLDVRSIRGVI